MNIIKFTYLSKMSDMFTTQMEVYALGCDLYNTLRCESSPSVSMPLNCWLLRNELSAEAEPFCPQYWRQPQGLPYYYDHYFGQYLQSASAAYYPKF